MRVLSVLALGCWLIPLAPSNAALSITLDFSSFDTGANWADLYNDDWDGSTPDAVKRAAAETTMRAAADYWETAFAASTRSISHTIAVGWGSHDDNVLATGGIGGYNNNPPTYTMLDGTLTWDNDGTSKFFVDTTPWEESEWAKESSRSKDLGAGAINIERTFYNAPSGSAARDNTDMMTVAIHEIAHALGFLGDYPKYAALDVGSDGDLDLVGGSEIGYSGGHHTLTVGAPEYPGYAFPYDGVRVVGDYYPTLMGTSVVGGTRKLATEADILTVASIHGFENPDTNPQIVPEGSIAGLMVITLVGLARRRRG